MSLFGTSPPSTPSKSASANLKSSLFDDTPESGSRLKGTSSGLFADEGGGPAAASGSDASSPWGFQPTPKRQTPADIVKHLLSSDHVPESYIDAFDALIDGPDRVGAASAAGVSWEGVQRLLAGAGVGEAEAGRILNIVAPSGQEEGRGFGRAEFNVLLALVGLAQEGEEVSLDSVDERRRRLPQPQLPKLKRERPTTPPNQRQRADSTLRESTPNKAQTASSAQRTSGKQSFPYPEADPWGSPSNITTSTQNDNLVRTAAATSDMNGMQSSMPGRTTSTFTTNAEDPSMSSTVTSSHTAVTSNEWGYESTASAYGDSGLETSDVFGGSPGISASSQHVPRPSRSSHERNAGDGTEEIVTVTALQEKEGMFMFQHRNYEVACMRKGSKVIRRYSDFIWLLDCLHKKYPFRQLPLLPPKRVAINGNHIAADTHFIEKRRRGLSRFANALVRHPMLSQEQLVVMFLTVPTELSVWRKQAAIQVQEEFTGKPLPHDLEDSLPRDLEDLFATVRSGVRSGAEWHITLCNLLERLVKRKDGLAAEYERFSSTLASASEASNETYAIDNNDVPLLNEGLNATAKHVQSSAALLGDECRAWDDGVLEDFKRQRDGLVSMRDMFDRRDRLSRDTIPALEKRIQGNEGRLAGVRAKPEGTRKPGEAEKLEESIMKDKESIIAQHARGVFIKECIRDEIVIFQASQYHLSRTCQDWAAERVKYAELQADCWRALAEGVESMPSGES